jgi:outer membrane protein TolC
VYEAYKLGDKDAHVGRTAQARAQYFAFRSEVETATSEVLRAENRLRYTLGLTKSDGRSIRPSDEPEKHKAEINWQEVHEEALSNRVELEKQRQALASRELELKAAEDESTHPATVRHHQLLIERENALLRDTELEVSHQVADAVRDVDRDFQVAQTRFNAVIAAHQEFEAFRQEFRIGRIALDLLLDAQRRRVDAERNYYAAAADYALSHMRLHERKGSLLEHHGVSIAEP